MTEDELLVLGDSLSQRGDPRGELVAIQTKLLGNPTSRKLRTREAELLAQYRELWLGPFAAMSRAEFHCTWSHGFIDWAHLGGTDRDALAAFARLPHVEHVTRLTVEIDGVALAPLRDLPRLEHLEIRGNDRVDSIADLPALSSLVFRRSRPALDDIELPALARLAIEDGSPIDLAPIATMGLRRLEIDVDGPWDLGPLWIVEGITELVLRQGNIGRILEGLLGSRLLPALESLDLSEGEIDARAVELLERRQAELHHVEIALTDTWFDTDDDDEGEAITLRLSAIPNVTNDTSLDD